MAPPANNLIMSGTSIRLFRHLEHQNPSIISGDIARARSMQQFWRNLREWNGRGTKRSTVVLDNRIVLYCTKLRIKVLYCTTCYGSMLHHNALCTSYIIPEAVLRVCVRRHKFYIQLALPISPEIMDGF